ncbi:MAG: ComF family protein [Lachnospiraceae bacterium]|nr:ComF family protein [Lachnospiraceae bacterium]
MGGLLFPPRCPICDRTVPLWNQGICGECLKQIKYVENPRCYKCGKHIKDNTAEYCEDCVKTIHYYLEGRALYEYKEVSASIYRFKYGGRQEYAKVFGEELAYYLGDYIRSLKPDAFIPVPMYPAKERRRGYNQAVLLARALGEALQVPVYEKMMKRIKNTKPLKLLNPEERLNNLKKAFILEENGVKLSTIVIIDDIYTTGSTIDAVARVFIEHGIENIYFVTLAIGETL